MQISHDVIHREIAGEHILVPIGELALRRSGVFVITAIGAEIWEMLKDGKEYDNWRLPTEAEIMIILQLQGSGTANSDAKAIDEVMNADAYFAANGVVNRVSRPGNTAVRCVRDAY